MLGITLAGYAVQNSLPAGPAWSAVFAFRDPLATFVLDRLPVRFQHNV
jgi:hypothetical protein